MTNNSQAPARQEWFLFGLRWALLLLIGGHLYNIIPATTTSTLLAALIAGGIANIAFLITAFVPTLRPAIPAVIALGDWITLFLLFANPMSNGLTIVMMVMAFVLISSICLDVTWSLIHGAGMLGVMFYYFQVSPPINWNPAILTLEPLIAVLALSLANSARAFAREYDLMVERQRVSELQSETEDRLKDMRERTNAVYEMSATLSATLDFEKVLNAALDAGRLGMRERNGHRVISMVLLFQRNGELRVVTGRRLPRADEGRVLAGKAGLLGEALTECVPVIGKDVRHDTELQYMVGFQQARSALCIPLRAGYNNFGVLLYGSEQRDAFTEEHMDLLIAIGTQATIALQNAMLYRNLAEEKERIVEVEEDARKKLARDLHDGPTQSISAIAMRMSYIYRLLERKPEEVPEELKKVEELARKTTKEIRDMLFTLRPLVLESQGLAAALDQLSQKMSETHGQAVAARVAPDAEELLTGHQQGVIFYIVEEAVNNARKHAEAELISVSINRQSDVVTVEISDNGVGFDTSAVTANYDQRGSLGMVNMRERTELIDGTLHIQSAEGRGTTITVLIPITGEAVLSPSRARRPKSGKIGAATEGMPSRLH